MPWRSNTLTKFSVGKSDDAGSDSDWVFLHVGLEPRADSPGKLHGAGTSEENLFGNFAEDVHETGCKGLQWDDCSFVEGQRMSKQGALDLKAKLVPRGPTLNEASFEQHLSHAFLSTEDQSRLSCHGRKEFSKRSSKNLMITCRTFSNSLVSGWGWMQCLKWKRGMSCRRQLAASTNWSEPFMSMLCHQFPISPFCNSVKTFWRLR